MLDVVRGVEVYLSKCTGHRKRPLATADFRIVSGWAGSGEGGEVLYVGREGRAVLATARVLYSTRISRCKDLDRVLG